MTGVGDKFVIEIGEVIENDDGNALYRIKGFNTLVFDDYGLKQLKPLGDITFYVGDVFRESNDQWNVNRFVITNISYEVIHFLREDGKTFSIATTDIAQKDWVKVGNFRPNMIERYLKDLFSNLDVPY